MIKVKGITHKGRVRVSNEDNYSYFSGADVGAAVVCDGIGGGKGGAVASLMSCDIIAREIKDGIDDANTEIDIRKLINMAVNKASSSVFNKSENEEYLSGMGTTVVGVVIKNDVAHIVHAGDSRVYVITPDGDKYKIEQLTEDHTVAQYLLDKGDITEDQFEIYPQKNLITRAVGIEDSVEIDYNKYQLSDGDVLVLCSDGLFKHVSDQEILELSLKEDGEKELVDLANSRGGTDNITAVIMSFFGGKL